MLTMLLSEIAMQYIYQKGGCNFAWGMNVTELITEHYCR